MNSGYFNMKMRKVFVILLALLLVGSTQFSKSVVNAETISEASTMSSISKVQNCPKCSKTVIYSGCQYKFSGGVYTDFAGQVCHGCNQIVPEGQRHLTYYDRDRYFLIVRVDIVGLKMLMK